MRTLLVLLATVTLVTVCSAKGKHCKYKKGGKWSDCTDGKQTSTKVLDEGSDPACEATKVKTRPCVPGCKYRYKGRFSNCDKETLTKTRQIKLKKKKEGSECPETLSQTVPCKYRKNGKRCKYSKPVFSECDKTTNKRTKTHTLESGNSEKCKSKVKEVPCRKKKSRKGRKGKKGKKF